MVCLLLVIRLLAATLSSSPLSSPLPEEKNSTLQERYLLMKSKAETYQDYKVIKEYVMDGVWKIMMDSVMMQRRLVVQERQTISKLESDLQAARLTLAREREAASEIVYDSSHIALLGIHFRKTVFLIIIGAVVSFFFLIGSGLVTKMKLLQATAKEKIVIADLLTRELEEVKQKAMDKQIKLARELQTERNKLVDLTQNLVK